MHCLRTRPGLPASSGTKSNWKPVGFQNKATRRWNYKGIQGSFCSPWVFAQVVGSDYDETSAPTAKLCILR